MPLPRTKLDIILPETTNGSISQQQCSLTISGTTNPGVLATPLKPIMLCSFWLFYESLSLGQFLRWRGQCNSAAVTVSVNVFQYHYSTVEFLEFSISIDPLVYMAHQEANLSVPVIITS